jgi:RNA polymerase sigma factor for flagellar operon FliA
VATVDLYLQHQPAIERAIGFVCKRQHLSRADAEAFASDVYLHLIENQCAVLRAFGGRSSIQTFLIAVVFRQFQDWRNAQWGKWRPSAEARRTGEVAVLLETCLVRDRLTMDETIETLRTNHGVSESREVLERMAARFPKRPGRLFVGEESLAERAAPGRGAETELEAQRARVIAGRAGAALDAAVGSLPVEDQLILRMRYEDGLAVSEIARALRLDQKPLYARVDRLLAQLRGLLESAGIDAHDAREVLDYRGFDAPEADGPAEAARGVRPLERRSARATGR